MTTNYARGRAFEYRVKEHLEALGYRVIRSAGSHSPVDLVAFGRGRWLFVQCKRDGKLADEEARWLKSWGSFSGAWVILASMPGRTGIGFTRWVENRLDWCDWSPA